MILYCYETYSAAVVHKAVDSMVEYYLIIVSRKILYTTNMFFIISKKSFLFISLHCTLIE